MKLKGFKQYIAEKQTDPDLVLRMQEYQLEESDICSRCGKDAGEYK